jgi:hypothetical protein
MKKLFIIISLFVFLSCEKDTLHCYKCETKSDTEIISTVTTCGMNETEIIDFQHGLEAQASEVLKCSVKITCFINK